MRAGDTVYNAATGETWTVAYVHEGRLAWNGWPPGDVSVETCELVTACSDEEHERALRAWADRPMVRRASGAIDRRWWFCREQLDALLEARGEFVRLRAVETRTVRFEPVDPTRKAVL